MKHKYIFIVADGVTEDDLYRLATIETGGHFRQGRIESGRYVEVSLTATPEEIHRMAHCAGFSGEQLRVAIPAAKKRAKN